MIPGFSIRTATPAEIEIAVAWAAQEGWNPGLHDAACFHAADAGGFLVGLLGDEPVATISVVRYGSSDGFLGFYIVKPQHRGKGYGHAIWQAGMKRLAGRNVGLDGVVAQQGNYRRSGFELAWQNVRHEGRGGGEAAHDPRGVAVGKLPFDEVLAYDRIHFPAGRRAFLQCWLQQPGSRTLAWLEHGAIRGYAMIRPCRSGWKVGPLFANSAAVAEALFAELRATVGSEDAIYLDTPACNPHAMSLARSCGMTPVFETARMYTAQPPAIPMDHIYGITSFELG